MDIDPEAPDHTTRSRRGQRLNVRFDRVASTKRIHLIVDSTGLSIVGEGEWPAVKHEGNGKRAWKKLHLDVDRSGVIVAELLTDGNAGDSNTALHPKSQEAEALIACNILNRMTELRRPESLAIGT